MAKKPRTAKQLANDERLRKLAAERRENKNPQKTENPEPQNHPAPDPGVEELKRQIEELKQQFALNSAFLQGQQSAGGAQVSRGRLVGTVEKFSTDESQYPDPRERLAAENRLAPLAFGHNYEMEWEVSVASYETKDGVNMKEPKFTLRLNRILLDDQGNQTNRRARVGNMIFFEDPQTAIIMANQMGLPVNDENELDFLNEMRYLRVRDWLFECFWPSVNSSKQQNKTEQVIGGKMFEVWEISSENPSSIPFAELADHKLKV